MHLHRECLVSELQNPCDSIPCDDAVLEVGVGLGAGVAGRVGAALEVGGGALVAAGPASSGCVGVVVVAVGAVVAAVGGRSRRHSRCNQVAMGG